MPPQRRADVTAARRAELEAGAAATRTLVEMLAIDFARLLAAAVPEADADAFPAAATGVVQRMEAGGAIVRACGARVARRLTRHPSDIVRGWAAYALAA